MDAAERFRRHLDRIGLVVTDLVMPQRSGKALTDEIRAASPPVPRLVMSSYAADVIKQKALAAVVESPLFRPIPSRHCSSG